jgi:two-component system LytT family sensor kinase
MPDYLLTAELLGFGAGTVLSILLALLVYRADNRRPGTVLLALCGLDWNVFGLVMTLLMLAGAPQRSLAVNLAGAACSSAGAIFPLSFLQLWPPPLAHCQWRIRMYRWLTAIARINAVWIIVLLFACPLVPNIALFRLTMRAVPWNASVLLTIGALTLVKGRLSAASDRIYLTLTLIGLWGSTISILLLEHTAPPERLASLLVITKEQSPFLAVVGSLFFFARFRWADVLIKFSLRLVAALSIAVVTCFLLVTILPRFASHLGVYADVWRTGLTTGIIASLLMLFDPLDRRIALLADTWILRQPDFRATLLQLWDRLTETDCEAEMFDAVERVVCRPLNLSAARVLPRPAHPVLETHAAANAGRLWDLPLDDPCRRLLPPLEIDMLLPIRVHGEITHVIAVAPQHGRRSLLNTELVFLKQVAGQIGSRMEALAHERERVERQSRESTLRRLAAQAELKALRAQINPHFLFNSLNTIADLIVTDPAKAETMTVLLAKIFRHVLMQGDAQLTRVAEEIEFLRTYLFIETVRFGDRLRVTIDVDPEVAQESIPSLILQPVVENAIKHGLAPKVGTGHLTITAKDHGEFVCLTVEDDGVGVAGAPKEGGLGLKIVTERLKTLYHERASMTFESERAAGSRVAILIPRREAAGERQPVSPIAGKVDSVPA